MTSSIEISSSLPSDFGTRAVIESLSFPLFTFFQATRTAAPDGPITGRTFRNCVIDGPAVLLALDGVFFDGCNLGLTPEGDVKTLLLRPMGEKMVTGAIAFRNCRFENCVFNGVGFTGPDGFLNHLIEALNGAVER